MVMSKGFWLLFAAVILLAATAVGHVVGFLLAAIVLAVPYWISLRTHPRTRHGGCRGTGEVRSKLFPWAFHKCPDCAGGRQIRHGARVFGSEVIKREHRTGVAARKRAKAQNRWR
jgi:hypothetical protein